MNQTVAQRVEKAISRTWMAPYPADPALEALTDAELTRARRAFPNIINDLNEEQRAKLAAIYREQRRRYEAERVAEIEVKAGMYRKAEATGKWPNGEPFPKNGQQVRTVRPGIGGIPSLINGIAKKRRDGTWYVRITSAHVGGAKTTDLTPRWDAI